MRLCPNKPSIDEFHLVEAFDSLQAKCEEFLGFWVGLDPVLGWLKISTARLAPENGDLLLNALGDIYLGADAINAHIGGVGSDGNAAQTAQPAPWSSGKWYECVNYIHALSRRVHRDLIIYIHMTGGLLGLKRARMGNGGVCRLVHFILCAKEEQKKGCLERICLNLEVLERLEPLALLQWVSVIFLRNYICILNSIHVDLGQLNGLNIFQGPATTTQIVAQNSILSPVSPSFNSI